MADIASETVFTNGVNTCVASSDLLRQAFQEVVDDVDYRDNNSLVAYFQSDGDDSQTIHLTHEQASALRLTFEIDNIDDDEDIRTSDNITYDDHEENGMINDIANNQCTTIVNNNGINVSHEAAMETLNFHNNPNDIVKVECPDLQEWTSSTLTPDDCLDNDEISIDDLEFTNDAATRRRLLEQLEDSSVREEATKIYASQKSSAKSTENSRLPLDTSTQRTAQLRDSQAQILQRLPIILPSSQFVLKPAQTIVKATKNVRILPSGTTKIGNFGTVESAQSTNVTTQNSILLPKGAVFAPRIIKATPITTQLLNGGALSGQLLNATQIFANAREFANASTTLSTTLTTTTATTTMTTTNFTGKNVRRNLNANLGMTKMSGGALRANNSQRFVVPGLKTTQDVGNIVKTLTASIGNTVKTGIPGNLLKSVQIPAQFFRNGTTTFAKGSTPLTTLTRVATTTPTMTTANSPLLLRTGSVFKAQETKNLTVPTTCVNSSILRAATQNSSGHPVSILKPQTRTIAFANASRQNTIFSNVNNVDRTGNNNTNGTNSRYQPKIACQSNDNDERIKYQANFCNKEKRSEAALATARVVKRAKIAGLTDPVAMTVEQTDTSKPLGSSENPIQIVQQGHTFHSMQRLTQSQLKQIAHVLQQRSQEATMPNERVVYRVVFPEELDLRMRNPVNLLKGRGGGKRGRPKKTAVRPSATTAKIPTTNEEEHEDTKDDRKKVVARTRSGRLSRPPRHMVRDYKHLHHLDFMQPDLDDSDGGYSDYNTNAEKFDAECSQSTNVLLSGLEVPKRKISDHFRCPTCNKIYLGRTRMARHFEMHQDHGSPEQLPPPTPDPELKRALTQQDPLKRKGKKRGPWAYVTPEAKSERRQSKLKEAISVCENLEIVNIAAKPVLNAQSMFDLLLLKSENSVHTFLRELKNLVDKIRENIGTMLTNGNDDDNSDIVNLNDESLCQTLGLEAGTYRVNNEAIEKMREIETIMTMDDEPPSKQQKINETTKEHTEERMSSGFSESSDLSVSDFLNERKNDCHTSANCPEVLMALTLMPRNASPVTTNQTNNSDIARSNSISKLLISNPEIQNQLSENEGFQKIDINSTKSYRKLDIAKDDFGKLTDGLTVNGCSNVYEKINGNYERTKQSLPIIETLQQAFIKLEPIEQNYKLENTNLNTYAKNDSTNYEKTTNSYINNDAGNYVKGFHKMCGKIVTNGTNELMNAKNEGVAISNDNDDKILSNRDNSKITDDLPMLQDSVTMMSNSCDSTSIFGSTDNLDIGKITVYDHIPHLDILGNNSVMEKHLMMDEKLVEQLHLVDQSNLVDELVSERLKNIMPDNILDNGLIPSAGNLDADLDFEALSEEFNRNTGS